jgi:hypothetical protein
MECVKVQEALLNFYYSRSGDSPTAMLNAHLMQCVECREMLTELVLVRAMARVARDEWGRTRPSGCK